ncbi:DNA adenine methylase [Psittacicella gerlachiana]|uniref:DNA adenine methylase n=1 Tax=Psittacicella gerlachiana TaxID=2028574 RepID=A0A3A1YKV1_9GAMM|nr:DNA adenine methylase [Psittacicella gerlachiana]RIY37839.1 hypothetical protein CKF59_01410 [Psittacicella gerlachiana]
MSAVEIDEFKDDDLFTSTNIAKYDQNIDFLLYVPADTKVPTNYRASELKYGDGQKKESKKNELADYTFIPLFALEHDQEEKSQKLGKEYVASPFNYNWGKGSVISQIVRLFPKNINVFYDLFSGAGNIGLNVNAGVIYCADTNSSMIQLLKFLQKHTFEELSRKIDYLAQKYGLSNSAAFGYKFYNTNSNDGLNVYNRTPYLNLRSDFNHLLRQLRIRKFLSIINQEELTKTPALSIKSALKPSSPQLVYTDDMLIRLLMLIIYGFNNFARFNSSGEFNLPVGKRDFSIKAREKFKDFLQCLRSKNIEFYENSFTDLDLNHLVQENSFVYLDPPCILNPEDLQVYKWGKEEENELYRTLEFFNQNGVKFALSTYIQFNGIYNYQLLDWCHSNRFNISFIKNDADAHEMESEEKFAHRTLEVVITNYFNE